MYAVKYEASRPAGNFRDTVPLKRHWALVRLSQPYGYVVIRRYATRDAALAAAVIRNAHAN